jgi:hypothetical protein
VELQPQVGLTVVVAQSSHSVLGPNRTE